jgi:hypothetical protein
VNAQYVTSVIARLDRATQYDEAPISVTTVAEYWATRFRGW